MHGDPLGFGGLDLPRVGRHLVPALHAGEMHFASQPQCATGDVDRHVATPEDQHPPSEGRRLAVCVGAIPTQPHVA